MINSDAKSSLHSIVCLVIFDFQTREIPILKNGEWKLSLYPSYGRV